LVEERQKLEGMRVQITKDMKELSDKRIIWSTSAVSQSGKENRTSPKKKSRFDSINKYIVPTFPTIDPNVLRGKRSHNLFVRTLLISYFCRKQNCP
jgi:hypothetical protein